MQDRHELLQLNFFFFNFFLLQVKMQQILLIRLFLKIEAVQKMLRSALCVCDDCLSWPDVNVTPPCGRSQ